jgi:predicted transposase YbfD/YdcC
VAISAEAFVFDVGSLCAHFSRLQDGRHRRGKRYSLVVMLTLMVLAKLSGHDRPEGMADWARLRAAGLAELLKLKRASMPHAATYGRVLAKAIQPEQLEREMNAFFAQQRKVSQQVQLALDGKQIRGTATGPDAGNQYLLGVYVPGADVMLLQMAIPDGHGELTIAPKVLKALDLQGKVVTGDAEFTQRKLSIQIVESHGHYVWKVKDNQPELRQDIHDVFDLAASAPALHAQAALRSYTHLDAGHGRIEQRTIAVSSGLKGYADWPHLEQVFKLDTTVTFKKTRQGFSTVTFKKTRQGFSTVTYGVTSLPAHQASPRQLLAYVRGHWQIENGSHYRRDVTFKEDGCDLRRRPLAHLMAILNNLATGLIALAGFKNAAHARRVFDASPDRAFALLVSA